MNDSDESPSGFAELLVLREPRKLEERTTFRETISESPALGDRAVAWIERTGKSDRVSIVALTEMVRHLAEVANWRMARADKTGR